MTREITQNNLDLNVKLCFHVLPMLLGDQLRAWRRQKAAASTARSRASIGRRHTWRGTDNDRFINLSYKYQLSNPSILLV